MIDFYRRGTMKFRCFIAALASAVLIILVLAIVAHCFNPNTSDSIGDNFSGMIGSTLALIGMSVAGSVFLIEFLESNAEKDSRYDTVSDDFRQDMESCIKWIIAITIGQILVLSIFLMMDVKEDSNMGGVRDQITYFATGLFGWNCCLILQFDYDLVTVKKRMRNRSERQMKLFCTEILQAIRERLEDSKQDRDLKSEIALIDKFLEQATRRPWYDRYDMKCLKPTNPRAEKLKKTFDNLGKNLIDYIPLLDEAEKKALNKGASEISDPFKLFYTMESMIECFVALPEGTVISAMRGFQAMNRMSDFIRDTSEGGEALFHDYVLFRELRDYAVVSGVISLYNETVEDGGCWKRFIRWCSRNKDSMMSKWKETNGKDVYGEELQDLYYYCMMFCSLVLQKLIANSMSKRKLSKIHFYNNNFSGAKMDYATIEESVLERTRFNGAQANGVKLLDVNADNLELDKAFCKGLVTTGSIKGLKADSETELDRWRAQDLDLTSASLDGSSMEYVSFRSCRISGIEMDHVSNRYSSYANVIIVEGNFKDVDFSMSDLDDVHCDSSDIYDSNFESCIMVDIHLNDVFIRNSTMEKIDGTELRVLNSAVEDSTVGGVLSESRVSDTRFSGLSAFNMEIKGCSFDAVSFTSGRRQAVLTAIDFRDCSFTDTSFTDVTMENIHFENVRFKSVGFGACRLDDVSFKGCTFIDSAVNQGSTIGKVSFLEGNEGTLHMEGGGGWNEYN